MRSPLARLMVIAGIMSCAAPASADDGRLLATGGITSLEGSAGGGIIPWAVIAGYGSEDSGGGTAAFSYVNVGDYQLDAIGAAWGINNRFEISYARQNLDLGTLGNLLAAPDAVLSQDIIGVKTRLYGDLIYDRFGQFALGAQFKSHDDISIPATLEAVDDSGTDVYLAWTKLWLGAAGGRNLLVNINLRSSEANELGLLGFGGDNASRELLGEASIALMLDRKTAIGFEYRQKPDNIAGLDESDWRDVFIAYFPSKSLALTAAWSDLGSIGGLANQTGIYLSAEASF